MCIVVAVSLEACLLGHNTVSILPCASGIDFEGLKGENEELKAKIAQLQAQLGQSAPAEEA